MINIDSCNDYEILLMYKHILPKISQFGLKAHNVFIRIDGHDKNVKYDRIEVKIEKPYK